MCATIVTCNTSNRLTDVPKMGKAEEPISAWGHRVRGSDKIPLFTRINARWIAHAYQERKMDTRNGETLKQALAEGRYGKQGTTRMPLRAGLLKKAKAWSNVQDTLT